MMSGIRGIKAVVTLAMLFMAGNFEAAGNGDALVVLENYLHQAGQARTLDVRATLDIQRLYNRAVKKEYIKEFESIFALPVEDPVYSANETLFFRSYANLGWVATINKGVMSVVQTLEGAFANITAANPAIYGEKGESLRSLEALKGLNYRFSIKEPGKDEENEIPGVFIPEELSAWHHLVAFWYPAEAQLGLPDSIEKVEVKTGAADEPYAYLYRPVKVDEKLMEYLKRTCGNDGLTEKDLKFVLSIDPKSLVCKSFSILVEKEGEQQSVFAITNVAETNTAFGIPVPTRSLIMTSIYGEDEDGSRWGTEYYCQVNVKSVDAR